MVTTDVRSINVYINIIIDISVLNLILVRAIVASDPTTRPIVGKPTSQCIHMYSICMHTYSSMYV